MGIEALRTGREWLRTALLDITVANGYAVEIKSTDVALDENPLKIPESKLPRAAVYVPPGEGATVTSGRPDWSASESVVIDVFFLAPTSKEDGRDRHSRDACTTYVDAVWDLVNTAHAAAMLSPAGAPPYRIAPAGEATYHYSDGPRTMVRIPARITTTWRPA